MRLDIGWMYNDQFFVEIFTERDDAFQVLSMIASHVVEEIAVFFIAKHRDIFATVHNLKALIKLTAK
ncbi:hypothetical protein VDIAB_250184 [Vibrio diabolicus]|nr:hypothetical protein VDIAB_250184 [Vibrio diabolicus]